MHYLLILIVFATGKPAVTSTEFMTKDACTQAARSVEIGRAHV